MPMLGIQQPGQQTRHNLSSTSISSSSATVNDPFQYMSLLPIPDTWLAADAELQMLPEIAEAVSCTQRGDFSQAEALLNRARDVGVAVVGETGELTQAADRRLLALSDITSNVSKAETILTRLSAGISEENMHERLLVGQSMCRMHLQSGHVNKAWRSAAECMGLVCEFDPEDADGQVTDVTSLELYSWCEMWAGTQDLVDGHLLAELLKSNDELRSNAHSSAHHAVVASALGSAGAIECLVNDNADNAIVLWETGSQPIEDSDDEDEDDDEDDASGNSKFMHALFRCANLNNIGMVRIKQGSFDEAATVLSTAMNLAQEIKPDNMKSREGALFSVSFARSLRLLARVMHAQEQAVSAEGLYRNAIDTLEAIPTPDGQLRPTHEFELVNAWEDFARLLDQWDKREGDAKRLRDKIKTSYEHLDPNLARLKFTFNVNLGWSL